MHQIWTNITVGREIPQYPISSTHSNSTSEQWSIAFIELCGRARFTPPLTSPSPLLPLTTTIRFSLFSQPSFWLRPREREKIKKLKNRDLRERGVIEPGSTKRCNKLVGRLIHYTMTTSQSFIVAHLHKPYWPMSDRLRWRFSIE